MLIHLWNGQIIRSDHIQLLQKEVRIEFFVQFIFNSLMKVNNILLELFAKN